VKDVLLNISKSPFDKRDFQASWFLLEISTVSR